VHPHRLRPRACRRHRRPRSQPPCPERQRHPPRRNGRARKCGAPIRRVLRECTLYTTLSPCAMCSGAILLYGIPRSLSARTSPSWVRSSGSQPAAFKSRLSKTRPVSSSCASLSKAIHRSGPRTSVRDLTPHIDCVLLRHHTIQLLAAKGLTIRSIEIIRPSSRTPSGPNSQILSSAAWEEGSVRCSADLDTSMRQ